MNEFFKIIQEFWAFIMLVAGGIGGFYKWQASRRKSTDMLYNELEKLKQKVILQVAREVDHASELAEKKRIIEGLKNHCPDCYKSFMKKYNEDATH